MSLQGLADFQQPISGDGFDIYYPFESVGPHIVMPSGLDIAPRNSDGGPDFHLTLLHGVNPFLPPAPYGILDFRLRPRYQLDQALALARAQKPDASLTFPSFTSGFLRIETVAAADGFPPELLKPIALGWNGLGTARFTLRISQDAAVILKQALQNQTLTLRASSTLEVLGVSPRVAMVVRFKSVELIAALAKQAAGGLLARQDVIQFFRQEIASLPLTLDRALDLSLVEDFANAMADRVNLNFAKPAPPPVGDHRPSFNWLPEMRRARRPRMEPDGAS